jgi:hypothetical protein
LWEKRQGNHDILNCMFLWYREIISFSQSQILDLGKF